MQSGLESQMFASVDAFYKVQRFDIFNQLKPTLNSA